MREEIEIILGKIKSDPTFAAEFKENPQDAVEAAFQNELPVDAIELIVDTVIAELPALKSTEIPDDMGDLFNQSL